MYLEGGLEASLYTGTTNHASVLTVYGSVTKPSGSS